MGLAHSPKIVTNGLVFYYDMGNPQKSWKGAPTTNLYADGDFSSQTLHPVRSGTWQFVPDPRNLFKTVLKATPSASTQYHGRDIAVTVSAVYSLQMEVYVSPDFNGTNVQMYPEQGGSGANRSYNLSNKGTWQLLKFDGKAATTANIRMLAYVLSAFTTGYVLISNVQVELSSFATLFVNGTRSNTQAILDLTNNNTITASSLTYASDNTFSFNGSSNWIQFPTSSIFDSQTITMESWNKPTTTSQNGFLFEKGQVNTQYSNFYNSNGVFYFRTIGLSPQDLTFTAATHIVGGQWNHIVCTVGGGVKTVYINGIQRYQQTGVTGTMPTGQTNQYVGKYGNAGNNYPFNGQIAISRVYNRALTAQEVQQNFQATKGRYGL